LKAIGCCKRRGNEIGAESNTIVVAGTEVPGADLAPNCPGSRDARTGQDSLEVTLAEAPEHASGASVVRQLCGAVAGLCELGRRDAAVEVLDMLRALLATSAEAPGPATLASVTPLRLLK